MERNIPDDHLDDFVRKSFEHYEAEPPSDMWSRVEEELLPPAILTPGILAKWRIPWQGIALTIILILLVTLISEHIYYQEKLRKLDPTQPVAAGNQEKFGPGENALPDPAQAVGLTNTANLSTQGNNLRFTKQEDTDIPKTGKMEHPPGFDHLESGEHSVSGFQNLEAKFMQIQQNTSGKMVQDVIQENFHPAALQNVETLADLEVSTAPKWLDLNCLPMIHTGEFKSKPVQDRIALRNIKPLHKPSGWYVGVRGSLIRNHERAHALSSRPNRPVFASQPEPGGLASMWWLSAGKKMKHGLSVETGLGFQQSVQFASHTPQFRFGDGTHSGPMSANRRAFNYDLSTSAGTAEISLRMETNSGTMPSDDERLDLKINTEHRMGLLRIPLMVKYQSGSGRLKFYGKAGLMGNIVTKNELKISARQSQNVRFNPVAGADGYTIRMIRDKFFLGYSLAAGGAFQLNRHFSLNLEPTLMGDFPRTDAYGRRLPDHFLPGLNLGLDYYF